jgi:cbb3-type cytochrome oxidase maturation protein
MSVIFLLIPLSIFMAAVFLGAFIWAVRSGQFEDTYTPSLRLLLPDPDPRKAAPVSALNTRTASLEPVAPLTHEPAKPLTARPTPGDASPRRITP